MSPRRIYIVEDEALIAMELQDHLQRLGYQICGHAARGANALREIQALRPDLVLMDVNLGRGVSGIEIAEKLRGLLDVPVVFLTAYSDVELAERAARTESFAYIVKPYQPQVLRANIEMALLKHDATRRLDEAGAALREQAAELQRSLALLGATLDATTDGVMIADEHELRGVNRAFSVMWGLDGDATPPTGDALVERLRGALTDPTALLADHREGATFDRLDLVDGRIFERRVRARMIERRAVGRVITFRDVTERIRGEERLREGEERFRRVVEHISDAVVVADLEGRIRFANDRFAQLLGVDASSPDLRVDDHVAAPWRAAVATHRRDRLRGDAASSDIVYRAQKGDGATLWIEATVVAVHDPGGLPIGTQSVLRDITERRETEEALRVLSTSATHLAGDALLDGLARHLARLLEAEVGLVVACAADGARVSRTIGLWVDDGRPREPVALDDLPLEVAAEEPALVDAGARSRWPASRALASLAAEGLALAPLVDSQGQRIGALGVGTRGPLRRPARVRPLLRLFAALAGANLERQREQTMLHDLFEYSPDAVLMVDGEGAIKMANRRALDLLDYSREALIGRAVEDLLPRDRRESHARLRRAFQASPSARTMGALKEPLVAVQRSGSTIPVDISLGPIHTDEGLLVVTSIRDMRAHIQAEERRRSLEQHLRHSQKLEALGTLAGGIAHDFNNILAAITANLELARVELGQQHAVAPRLLEIATATQRATLLVRQILAFSRRQAPRRAVIPLAPVVQEAVQLLRHTLPPRIALDIIIDPDIPPVLADATQIHQVLMNLGTNAWHAIHGPSGTITVHLAHEPGSSDRGKVSLTVRDTGCGMDVATLERIFEPFFTTKPIGEGSGLGLSVVHGIITEHGGEIRVESRPGRGSAITILIPATELAPAASSPDAVAPPPSKPWRVILIDDDPVLALVGEALLTHLGHHARSFVDPAAAIEALRAAPDAHDLVITDFNMPSMSGIDLAHAVAAIRPDLPVILASGHTGRTDEELTRAGIRHRLDKPFHLVTLDRLIRTVQSERAALAGC